MESAAYLGLIFFILFVEIARYKETKFDFLTLFNIYFLLWYALPAFVLAINSFSSSNSILKYDDSPIYTSNIQSLLAIFLGYFFVLIGFYSKSAHKQGKNILIEISNDNKAILLGVFLFLFGCLSIHIYSLQHGGFFQTLSNSTLIRASSEVNLSGGKLLFLKPLMFFIFFASYLLGSFVLIKKIRKGRLILLIIFLVSIIVSLLAAIMAGGRAQLIDYFIVFYLGWVLLTRKIHLKFLITLLFFTILFILYGKAFFFSLTSLTKGFAAVVDTFFKATEYSGTIDFNVFMANFTYPIHSLDAAFEHHYDMRLFVDFYYAIIALLPDRLLGTDEIQTIVNINSYYVAETNEYAIPPGFLAFSIYSMSWPGLIIFCLIYGWIGRYLHTILKRHLQAACWMPLFYVLTAKTWGIFVTSGDPQFYINSFFWYFSSSFLLIFIVNKINFVENRNHKISTRRN